MIAQSSRLKKKKKKKNVVGLWSCRPVANDVRQMTRCRRRVVAMSHCRSVQINGLAYKGDKAPHDNAPFDVLR
jgi:hypothetical protein